jgi:threonylcarbamoyladenosine tRNA methylthiotransferase MtaB
MSAAVQGIEIVTFGCRLNAAESEVIRRAAAAAGLEGAVIVNTCAVTAEAERQARQAIRRARRDHPEAHIIVTGCAATLARERYAAMPEIDQVLDNAAKLRAERGFGSSRPAAFPRCRAPGRSRASRRSARERGSRRSR